LAAVEHFGYWLFGYWRMVRRRAQCIEDGYWLLVIGYW
jgi:hypothetical protein